MNPVDPGGSQQRPGAVYASRQVQNWTRGLEIQTARQREVIAEKRTSLPILSRGGIRWDVLVITLTLLALLFTGILFADLEALYAGGNRIGKLSAGIESLEGSNTLLREQLSIALNHPVLRNQSAAADTEKNLRVIRSTVPEE